MRIVGKVTRLYVMPVEAEPLGEDAGQMFYGTPDGLGSTTDLSKFVTGPVVLGEADTPGEVDAGS